MSPDIYVVDDDLPVRESLARLLSHRGAATVGTFASGGAFLQALDGLAPGIILLDYQMPRPDGLEVLQELQRRGTGFPVVMVTAHGDLRIVAKAMRYGACDFLEKPYSLDELRLVVAGAAGLLRNDAASRERCRAAQARLACLSGQQRSLLQALISGSSLAEAGQQAQLDERQAKAARDGVFKALGVDTMSAALRVVLASGMPIDEGAGTP